MLRDCGVRSRILLFTVCGVDSGAEGRASQIVDGDCFVRLITVGVDLIRRL